mmetsp:Transcript_24277/g.31605  ORF Transcript_24277/g.31605 Transcript_24277/m.31605 type:complete len:169 (+) Transcript_24277:152-658(+)|eukprot:CAMPEP_0197304470 /NCGR_PEP_ID=MMETSP0890-20130614/52271_1 /TAXON_ID=44058 ORGANISM="Aureoumbra lagunensis, Strain CCMP1510" /NCGR_SAMPLE_ID=MMETSP0890 /ASSEMBLY_ACC=CAM_ASM_000533 /LENGTH=168 /DNA_ID=CAMNT_0042784483 /DNA_START=127 /DNA_END=633 /DNA_ORIENTATION=+
MTQAKQDKEIAIVSPNTFQLEKRGLKRRRSEQPSKIVSCGSDVSDNCVATQCERELSAWQPQVDGGKKEEKLQADEFEVTSALVSLKHSALPKQKRLKTDLVAKCLEFTTELKQIYPPGSPVFTLFQIFVRAQSRDKHDLQRIVLEVSQLLKHTPNLLRKFCALLPRQ